MNKTVSMDEIISLIEEQLQQNGKITFTPKGISMLPLLRNNQDIITLRKPQFPLKKYDVPFYRRENGQYVLHRVVRVENDTYVLRGDNQLIDEHGIKEEQIIAVMESFTRKGKTYSCDDRTYRLYCIIWVKTHIIRKMIRKTRRLAGKVKRKLLRIVG